MRKTKKNCFPNLKSLLKKLKGGMAPVTWGETNQPPEAVMQHATTAGGRRRTRRTRHTRHKRSRRTHTRRN